MYNNLDFFCSKGFLAGKKFTDAHSETLADHVFDDYFIACDGYILPRDAAIDYDG